MMHLDGQSNSLVQKGRVQRRHTDMYIDLETILVAYKGLSAVI